ncbi:uncharacterized protein LOC108108389 [Drosophila eugracilis]|uniref:uncharacterized protein LOC108108389 n=1 Tax=Drosophila eugracilis TaxID=29029 RepID=UPI0007E84720|nr:uncharacterized protein LOC108108389 [Drosophila eugracilis]
MSLRLILICLAILAMVYAQPAPGAPEIIEDSEPVQETSEEPLPDGFKRTLVLLLPILFPNSFYSPVATGK